MRSLLSFACLALSLVLAGCSTPPERRLESPGLAVTGLTFSGDTAALALRFTNPNTVPLVVTDSTHTLYLGDKRIGGIDDRDPIGIPPMGSIIHTVALPKAVAAKVGALLARNPGEVRAGVESELHLILGSEDTLTLKSSGSGLVKAP